MMGITLALGAFSTKTQMDATKDQARYSAQVANNNAINADNEAIAAANAGSIEEENHRAKVRQIQGSQRANLAANGVDISDGTALDLMTETAAVGETDALMLRFNAMRQAWGSREQAKGYRAEAVFGVAAAKQKNRGTLLTGIAGAVGTAASGYGTSWGKTPGGGFYAGMNKGKG